MSAAVRTAALAVIGLVASQAAAQLPGTQRAHDIEDRQNYWPTTTKGTVQVRTIIYDYARCVVKKNKARASEAILTNVSSNVLWSKYRDLISSSCLGRVAGNAQAKFGGDTYRYALADALVNETMRDNAAVTFSDRQPLDHPAISSRDQMMAALAKISDEAERAKFQDQNNPSGGIAWISRFGECVVRRDPVNSRLWLLTRPDATEELGRIDVLRPAFAACIADGTLRFSKVVMRGTVAINYYRLAMATLVAGKTQ